MLFDAGAAKSITKAAIEKKKLMTDSLDPKLIEVVFKRIKSAAEDGKFSTTLNSLNDYGNGARGLGVYLSESVISSLTYFLREKDFVVEDVIKDNSFRTILVRWE